jgi:hypothetical protein
MALMPKVKPKFENVDEDIPGPGTTTNENVSAKSAQDAAAALSERMAKATAEHQAAQTTAVATKQAHAVAVPVSRDISPFKQMENAFHVSFGDLPSVLVTQGNFQFKDGEQSLGGEIVLELLSHQPQFAIGTGEDGDEAAKLARYSDDGVTTTQGEDVVTYIADLKGAGYDDTKMTQRIVIVGAIHEAAKNSEGNVGKLVQISLPPTSRAKFNTYTIQSAFDISRGKTTLEQAKMMRLTAKVTTKARLTWTVAEIAQA